MSKTMRLIDADALIKDLGYLYTKNHIPVDMRAKQTLSTIMKQPTAYDVDKIVEQLKTDSSVKLYGSDNSNNYLISLEKAIKIVKTGGNINE